jgi:hypothetical protein|tara:strand:- start:473 stop:1114 length:642 start_codon:yes stop_codon:yes gene_type:complete
MVNIKLVPTWVWIAIPLIALLTIGLRQSMEASYYRGVADDAERRVEIQEVVLDSVTSVSDSLSVALEHADSIASEQRRINEREVARLTRERIEARDRSQAISERLRMSLDSMQAVELDSIVIGYEIQIQKLDSIVVVERETRMAEALRADQASELILSLRGVIGEHEIKDFIQAAEIAALRGSMRPSLGLRLKADWWLAVVGLAGGYVLWGTK